LAPGTHLIGKKTGRICRFVFILVKSVGESENKEAPA